MLHNQPNLLSRFVLWSRSMPPVGQPPVLVLGVQESHSGLPPDSADPGKVELD